MDLLKGNYGADPDDSSDSSSDLDEDDRPSLHSRSRVVSKNNDSTQRRSYSRSRSRSDGRRSAIMDGGKDSRRKVKDKDEKSPVPKSQVTDEMLEQKRNAMLKESFGYTNEENPFGDSQLSRPFFWRKKWKESGFDTSDVRRIQHGELNDRQQELQEEIKKTKSRRLQREKEQRDLEEMQKELAREAELEANADWRDKEETFLREQTVLRAQTRLIERRALPIDLCVLALEQLDSDQLIDESLDLRSIEQRIAVLSEPLPNPMECISSLMWPELQRLRDNIEPFLHSDQKHNSLDEIDDDHNYHDGCETDEDGLLLNSKDLWNLLQKWVEYCMEKQQMIEDETSPAARSKLSQIYELENSLISAASTLAEMDEIVMNAQRMAENDVRAASSGGVLNDEPLIDADYWTTVWKLARIHRGKLMIEMVHQKRNVQRLTDLDKLNTALAKLQGSGDPDEPESSTLGISSDSIAVTEDPLSSSINNTTDTLVMDWNHDNVDSTFNDDFDSMFAASGYGRSDHGYISESEIPMICCQMSESLKINSGNSDENDSDSMPLMDPSKDRVILVDQAQFEALLAEAVHPDEDEQMLEDLRGEVIAKALRSRDSSSQNATESSSAAPSSSSSSSSSSTASTLAVTESHTIQPAMAKSSSQQSSSSTASVMNEDASKIGGLSKVSAKLMIAPKSGKDEEMYQREMKKGSEDNEFQFGQKSEVTIPLAFRTSTESWHSKYEPRKPRYFNRVRTGYSWNKYNQTHFDSDNPPPKIVLGYKFNVFYPDLIDPSTKPRFRVLEEPGSEYATIIFHSGPPYEDIAFKIVNNEWETFHKRGYRCRFEKGIFSLYFNFKRYRYRR